MFTKTYGLPWLENNCFAEDGNVHNEHAVAVISGDKIVGHVPCLLHFLRSLPL